MDSNQQPLALDPSVMTSKNEVQEIESIDQKYGVELFTSPSQQYNLYPYEVISNNIYSTDKIYSIDLDPNQFTKIYTTPVIYPVDTQAETIDITSLLVSILVMQLIVVVYFGYKIISIKGKNEKNYS